MARMAEAPLFPTSVCSLLTVFRFSWREVQFWRTPVSRNFLLRKTITSRMPSGATIRSEREEPTRPTAIPWPLT